MNIGIYNIYFESEGIGGGERYMLTAGSHWSKKHDVSIICDNEALFSLAESRFGIDTKGLRRIDNFFRRGTIIEKIIKSAPFDVIFFLTDGSVPTSLAKRNILHFQVPFSRVDCHPWKRKRIQAVVCNSRFTKLNLDPLFGTNAHVIYPPVDVHQFRSKLKKPYIISVGRFTSHWQAKKQEILIDAFRQLSIKSWQLVLVGGLMASDRAYFESLREKARGLDVRFYDNVDLAALAGLYAQASIYWHAAGFGETNPMNMEHFGMSTVEAMASECIPFVFDGGGQPEIVVEGKSGFLWKTPEELIRKTEVFMDSRTTDSLRDNVKKRAMEFDVSIFTKALDELLEHL